MKHFVFWLCVIAICVAAGCGGSPKTPALSSLRSDGVNTNDAEIVGRWLLAEQIAPGGDAKHAADARARLAKLSGTGLYASFARGVDGEEHGDPTAAAKGYLGTLVAARQSNDPDAQLIAWFSAQHLHALRSAVANLYTKERATLDGLASTPGGIGWRAAVELIDWTLAEAFRAAETTGKTYNEMVVKKNGCVTGLRLAGPFGRGSAPEARKSFEAETPAPWPPSWPLALGPDGGPPVRGTPPHILKSEQPSCLVASTEGVGSGIFYVEGFVTTPAPRDVILSVQGALAIWIDGHNVFARDAREWGSLQRVATSVHIAAGRHRIVARIVDDSSSIRMLAFDGTTAGITSDPDPRAPHVLSAPTVLDDPNPLVPIVKAQKTASPLLAFVAAQLAHLESQNDVAAVLMDPWVTDVAAASLSLEYAAIVASSDPAYPDEARHRRARDFFQRSQTADPRLWYTRAWLILDDAEQKGLVDAVDPLRKLAEEFAQEPEVLSELARVYGRLGWRAERMKALADLAGRFPDSTRVLSAYLGALDADGAQADADKVAKRLGELDPDAEIELDRALDRHDWKKAIAELERLKLRRPDRKEIAGRIADVLQRSGDPTAAFEQLKAALAKNPRDPLSRFRLADRAFAAGDASALRKALADSLLIGSKTEDLRAAIDLLEGATDLEPFRQDGAAVIREFEAWEKKGKKMAGTAARVLDYAALWVHTDGSSDMLEHEILRIQSQEAIGKEAEQEAPSGLTLKLRVVKPSGKILEPEPIAGKPTLTMPNLEVGDYIEIEHITPTAGDGDKGLRYRSPHWFFREADKGYWRSEFVVLTPKNKELDIETRGDVGAPKVVDRGLLIERRWRVDESPPLVMEPDAPSPVEFLPSVHFGWGISFQDSLARFIDGASDETPLDPRLYKYAEQIVAGVPATDPLERARRVYRAVLEQIQDGRERDGRRVIMGKAGSRQAAFQHLLHQLGISTELVLVKDRLAMPPLSKMSEIEGYGGLVLRIDASQKITYLTVSDKFAPFGYIPAEFRDQPGVRLISGAPKETVHGGGMLDGVTVQGRADLKEDGSAQVAVAQIYSGNLGIRMRNILDKIPESQLFAYVESRVLPSSLPGARVRDVKIENAKELDKPLIVNVKADMTSLAKVQGGRLIVQPVFAVQISQFATLPKRTTPLLIGASSHLELDLQIVAAAAIKMPPSLPTGEAKDGDRVVRVNDTIAGHALTLKRYIDIPAGRVQPDAYATFQQFTQAADLLLDREVVLGL